MRKVEQSFNPGLALIGLSGTGPCSPKLARKYESEHWLPFGTDALAVYGYVITTFSGMGRYGARSRALRARGAPL